VAKFPGRRADLKWGKYDFPVTFAQKTKLDALGYLVSGLPVTFEANLPDGLFYSQNPRDGSVIFGLNHRSVTVYRSGRIVANHT